MKSLKSCRSIAFLNQKGCCYYCSRRMWFSSPSELGLSLKSGRPYQCTAEHLIARQDGGRDVKENIVAACWFCNTRRHRRKSPPSPDGYRARVQKRVAKGKWHSQPKGHK